MACTYLGRQAAVPYSAEALAANLEQLQSAFSMEEKL